MIQPTTDNADAATLPLEPDSDRPDALESLRHPTYFGRTPEPAPPTPQPMSPLDSPADSVGAVPQAPAPAPPTQAPAPPKRKLAPVLIGAVVLVAFGGAAALFFSGYFVGKEIEGGANLPFAVDIGEPVPAFRGYLLDPAERGPLFTRDDTVGRPLVLAVWSAGDERTPAFLRAVTNLTASEAYADATVLGVNLDVSKEDAIQAVVDTSAFTWPHLYNADPRLDAPDRPASVLNVSQTPALYYIDAVGRLRQITSDVERLPDTP